MRSNREFEKVVAGFLDGSCILFKMKNGYFYLVNIGDKSVGVFKDPNQLARFNPYIFVDNPEDIPAPAIAKAVKLLKTLPADVYSHKISEKPEDL